MFHESLVPENDQDEDRRQPDSAGFLEQRATVAIGVDAEGTNEMEEDRARHNAEGECRAN
jgi:hypothetical protein